MYGYFEIVDNISVGGRIRSVEVNEHCHVLIGVIGTGFCAQTARTSIMQSRFDPTLYPRSECCFCLFGWLVWFVLFCFVVLRRCFMLVWRFAYDVTLLMTSPSSHLFVS